MRQAVNEAPQRGASFPFRGGASVRTACGLGAVLGLLFVSGCIRGLDKFNDVRDLRILAIRAEPPEVMYRLLNPPDPNQSLPQSYLPMFQPSTEIVRLEALVIDPRGGALEHRWEFCPVESGNACGDFDAKLAAYRATLGELDATFAELDARLQGVTSQLDERMLAQAGLSPDDLALKDPQTGLQELRQISAEGVAQSGPLAYTLGPFWLAPTMQLLAYHTMTNVVGAGLGSWPSVVLNLSNTAHTEQLRAQKRFVVSIDPESMVQLSSTPQAFAGILLQALIEDWPNTAKETLLQVLGESAPNDSAGIAGESAASVSAGNEGFGVKFCPPGKTPHQVPGCLFLEPREPNRNPEFAAVKYAYGASAETPEWLDLPQPLFLAAGQAIRILPVFTPGSEQTYQILEADLQTRVIRLKSVTEEISVTWFSTAAELADSLTWPKFTLALDTIFWTPPVPPVDTDGWVTLWLVARDQRGGIAWRTLEIRIEPARTP